MAKPRNYAAEYARRIQKGIEQGFSRSQARGHPRTKFEERSVREIKIERKSAPPIPLHPRNYNELSERYHGKFHGAHGGKSYSKNYNTASFPTLHDALNFAQSLPANSSLYIKQYGYQINFVNQSSDQVGSYTWRSLSQLMTPGFVARQITPIERKSTFIFDRNSPSEFTVNWKKI